MTKGRLADFESFVNNIVGSDLRLRMVRPVACRVVAAAVLTDPDLWGCHSQGTAKRILRERILEACQSRRVGNWLIVISIIGIVIQLIWQWWLHRRSSKLGAAAATCDWEHWRVYAEEQLQ